MKKNLYACMAILFACSLMFSCSDDKDPQPPVGPENVNGTYGTGDNVLKLMYSDAALLGKTVSFTTSDKETATIVLNYVIPGEATTTLSEVKLDATETQYSFGSNTVTTETGWTVTYKGSVKDGEMSLDLTVKMPENALTGTWNPNATFPLHYEWVSGEKIYLVDFGLEYPWLPGQLSPGFFEPLTEELVTNAMQLIGGFGAEFDLGALLGSVLRNVAFLEDGNIVAEYSKAGVEGWLESPKNLVHYYVSDNNQIKVILNPTALFSIIDLSGLAGGGAGITMDDINSLLANLSDLLTQGIPLGYRVDGGMQVYIQQELVERLLSDKLIYGLLSTIEIKGSANLGMYIEYEVIIADILAQLPDIFAVTKSFEIGLILDKK